MSRVFIRKPLPEDWHALLILHRGSKALHSPWVFPPYSEADCKAYIDRCQREDFEGLLICHHKDGQIIGVANLSQIFYRAFQNAYLGYYVNAAFSGQGFMAEGLPLVINHAFKTLALHRIEANIQPENVASLRLVKQLGFTLEGFSRRYLYINGAWRDHERWALTVEDW